MANQFFKIGNKYKDNFFKNVTSTFLAQVVLLFLSILTAAIVARWLGPEKKGILALAMLIPSILRILLNGGIGVANVYFVSSRRMDVQAMIVNSINFTYIATSIGVVFIIILMATGLLKVWIPGIPLWAIIISLCGFPISLLSGYLGNILQGLQQFFLYNMVGIVQSIFTLVLIFILVIILETGLLGALFAYLATAILSLIIMILLFHNEIDLSLLRWNTSIIRLTLSFGLKGHVGNILQYFNYRVDMFIVNYFLGPSEVGIYSVSVGLAELLWYFPNAVGFVIFPKAASTKPEVMNIFTPRVFRFTLWITSIGAIGLLLLGKPIIEFVYSSTFLPSYVPMIVLLPGVVLLGGAKVLTNEIAGRGYPHYNSINSGIALILTITLDLLLISRYGILGAALASSIAYAVIFFMAIVFYLFVSKKKEKLLPSLQKPFDENIELSLQSQ